MHDVAGVKDAQPIFSANAFQTAIVPDQLEYLTRIERLELIELDPIMPAAALDDVSVDLEVPAFRLRMPDCDGRGVTVAVIDSGVDTAHPYLNVAESVSTAGESAASPGEHGTHCAGIIASTDETFRGIAPGVRLVNVKALFANSRATPNGITRGVDAALDANADVLSMSIGFNHLPTWSHNGAGWTCAPAAPLCTLCQAVDNAWRLGNRVVVVAGGNWHSQAEKLRADGHAASFDTELNCPGQSENVITVGAITKRMFEMAPFSSRGPTGSGSEKPDVCAPGVNITSTIPRPRNADGTLVDPPPRARLFARLSGTSMATPAVAGAAAVLIGRRKRDGRTWTNVEIKDELIRTGVVALPFGHNEGGAGRLSFARW
ncbi:MAG: hypothetical protein JWO56_3465 [Acidobacteria bacterium]|nr:hypothetical protein [Acidobacteriota bacterium]